jgi:hypothetical protein
LGFETLSRVNSPAIGIRPYEPMTNIVGDKPVQLGKVTLEKRQSHSPFSELISHSSVVANGVASMASGGLHRICLRTLAGKGRE